MPDRRRFALPRTLNPNDSFGTLDGVSSLASSPSKKVQLIPGTRVDQWKIITKLGEGGFGAVYKIKAQSRPFPVFGPCGEYAFKVVNEDVPNQVQALKMEVAVLTAVGKGRKNEHFCSIIGHDSTASFHYVAMTLVGKSLQDLRKKFPGGHFSLGTALSIGIQGLEALEDLHSIGYLNRDAKPSNFTVGRAALGELRKGVIRKQHHNEVFRGTVRYASIASHDKLDVCRKDDLETWLYMQIEITTGKLPWRNEYVKNKESIDQNREDRTRIMVRNKIGDHKKSCRIPPAINELFTGCPGEYIKCLTIIDNISFYETPNYAQIYQILRGAITTHGVHEFPYDWEK